MKCGGPVCFMLTGPLFYWRSGVFKAAAMSVWSNAAKRHLQCERCQGTGAILRPVNGHFARCPACEGTGLNQFSQNEMKWHNRFLRLAQEVAAWSKDPSTKVGAVLVREDRTVASLGFNGFPKGSRDGAELLGNRSKKYPRMVHAEINAVLFCRDPLPLSGHTLYTTLPCCDRCVTTMLQCGIRNFVCLEPDSETDERWGFKDAFEHLDEHQAKVIWLRQISEEKSSSSSGVGTPSQ